MVRGLIEDFYDIQKYRIEVENQLRSAEQGASEQEQTFIKNVIVDRLTTIESEIEKYIGNNLKNEPMYTEWLKGVKGIGPLLSAGLIAWIGDIERFATISKLWAYCGLSVDPDGRARKRKAGEKSNWSSRLKTLAWKAGESFVKTKGGYRKLYDIFRAEYDAKWLTPEDCGSIGCKNKKKCLDGHRYAAAKRKTAKVFLAHYWMKARQLKGLPEEHPFIIGRDGHEHLIEIINE